MEDKKTTNTKKAFRWIVDILKKHKIPFQITGGLAAQVYGSKRQLYDIDIDIPEDKFNEIMPVVKDYIIFGPSQFKDKYWNILLLTLNYHNQHIDISGANKSKIFNSKTNKWCIYPTNLLNQEKGLVFGIKVPVISMDDLIKYKRMLNRKEDKQDIKAIEKNKKKILTLCMIYQHPKLLLGMKKRGFGRGRWNGFGGKLKDSEDIKQAAKREIFEEVGLTVNDLKQMGILEFEFKNEPEIFEVHIFRIVKFSGKPKESEEMKPNWFHIDKIPYETMWPDDKYWLPLFLQRKKFKGKFWFEGMNKIIDKKLFEVKRI